MKTVIGLMPFVALLTGCPGVTRAIPDARIPHQLSQAVSARVWVRLPSDQWVEQEIAIPEGWWVAGPLVVGK